MTITLTSTTTSVILNVPDSITISTSRNIQLLSFTSGNIALMDKGYGNKSIIMTGVETSTSDDKMKWLNYMMDNKEIVTISGLPDTNLNTVYYIADLSFKREAGEVYEYDWTITCDKKYLGSI
jgi:hypothetical protein